MRTIGKTGHFSLPDVTRFMGGMKQLNDNVERPVRSGSRLERVLRSGRFAVTAELNAPDSADPDDLYKNAMEKKRLGRGLEQISSTFLSSSATSSNLDPTTEKKKLHGFTIAGF